MTIAPVLKYPGSKWRLAHWICEMLPGHTTYLEPFFGSGAVFFTKTPSRVETINDLDGDVVNLFRVLRERPEDLAAAAALTPYAREEHDDCWACRHTGDPIEDARRFLVRIWMNHGMRMRGNGGWSHASGAQTTKGAGGLATRALQWRKIPDRIAVATERLRMAQIEHRPGLWLIEHYRHAECLIYADPPYVHSTRTSVVTEGHRQYAIEMSDAEHVALLAALDAHPGPVLLSGYRCDLYDANLGHWRRLERQAMGDKASIRTESLWLNSEAVRRLGARQLTLLPDDGAPAAD